MDHVEQAFFVLSHRMDRLAVPGRTMVAPESLSSLIDKVNAAKRHYQPGARR